MFFSTNLALVYVNTQPHEEWSCRAGIPRPRKPNRETKDVPYNRVGTTNMTEGRRGRRGQGFTLPASPEDQYDTSGDGACHPPLTPPCSHWMRADIMGSSDGIVDQLTKKKGEHQWHISRRWKHGIFGCDRAMPGIWFMWLLTRKQDSQSSKQDNKLRVTKTRLIPFG